MNKTLYWAPRVFAILFTVLISLLVLDVFINFSWLALLMHLLPTLVLLIALLVAWKWEMIGGIVYIFLGLIYIIFFRVDNFWTYVVVAGPALVIGILFLVAHLKSKETPQVATPELESAEINKSEEQL